MYTNLNLSVETISLPKTIKDCYKIDIVLPITATIIHINLVDNNGQQQLNFWLLRNNGSKTMRCHFYLLNKNKNAGCLKCDDQQTIEPIPLFQHKQYILVGLFEKTPQIIKSLRGW